MLDNLTFLVRGFLPPRDIFEDVKLGRDLGDDYKGDYDEFGRLFKLYVDNPTPSFAYGLCRYINHIDPETIDGTPLWGCPPKEKIPFYGTIIKCFAQHSEFLFRHADHIHSNQMKLHLNNMKCDFSRIHDYSFLSEIAHSKKLLILFKRRFVEYNSARLTVKQPNPERDQVIVNLIGTIDIFYVDTNHSDYLYTRSEIIYIIEKNLTEETKKGYLTTVCEFIYDLIEHEGYNRRGKLNYKLWGLGSEI